MSRRADLLPAIQAGPRLALLRRLALFGLAQGGLAAAATILVGQLLEAGTSALGGIVGLIGCALLLGLLKRAETLGAERLGQHYVLEVRDLALKRLLAASDTEARRFSQGALMLRLMSDLSGLRRWASLGVAAVVADGALLLALLGSLMFLMPALAAATLGACALLGLALVGLRGPLKAADAELRRRRARLAAEVADRIQGRLTIQACAQERRERRRLAGRSAAVAQASIRRAGWQGWARAASLALSLLMLGATVLAAPWLAGESGSEAAAVVTAVTLAGLLRSPLLRLSRAFELRQSFEVARSKLHALLALPARPGARPGTLHRQDRAAGSEPRTAAANGSLRLCELSIDGVLNPTSLSLPGTGRLVLCGPDAKAKRQLLKTLAGLLTPSGGAIDLNGEPPRAPAVMLVSPELPLLRGSLGRNLRYARPDIPDRELEELIEACGLAALVARLPQGLDAPLGDGALELSQAERARVQLARSLAAQPQVLLLHAWGGVLDHFGRCRFERVLTRLPRTLIIVDEPFIITDGCSGLLLHDGQMSLSDHHSHARFAP